jgi:myo-inositol-1(or 4)-monophosphatase
MLNVAVRAARAAGAIINRAALDVEAVRVAQKQAHDFVTEVDQASEAAIIEMLLTAYPGHGILAEESGRVHGNPHSDHIWIIDPLDGTTNFIHGFPVYCVSIGLQVAGRIEQAVVYDPTRNDLFTATRGRGAFLNDRRIRVSKRLRLADCLIATGFPYRPGDDVPTYLQMMGAMMCATAGMRRPGSAALDLAYVAAGFSDGFFETGLKPWDVAAGSLLVTEAGGLVGNFAGDALQLDVPECLAANPRVYAQMVSLLGRYSRAGQPPASQPQAPDSTAGTTGREPLTPEESIRPETINTEDLVQSAPSIEAGPIEAATASEPISPATTTEPQPVPRPRLRAAPRRAPGPLDEPQPRYSRAPGAGPRDTTGRPVRPGRPAQASNRDRPYGERAYGERPYGKPAAKPAGKFGERKSDGSPAFSGRPPRARPPFDERSQERSDRYPAGPRRRDDAPRGKPYAPAAPRAAGRPARPQTRDTDGRAPGNESRSAPRARPYTPRSDQ